MVEPRPRSASELEKGPSQHGPDTDSSSLPGGVDAEKRSGEQTRQAPTAASDDDTGREDQRPISRHPTQQDAQDGGDSAGNGVLSRVLSRVLTRPSTKSSWNPPPPPDGGMQAWIAVACTHLVVMNTWGIVNSFGLFQTHYTTALGHPPSDISWIGSIQIFLLFFVGALTGRLTDAGYFRHVFALGVTFQILGIFTTSAATQYWQVLLAQGVCMGLGNGCLFCPSISTLSTYFSKRRSLAIGMAACGTATGGLIFPGMVRQLLPTQGFPATMRAIGYVQVATFAVAFVGLKPRIPPRRSGPWVEWRAFREGEYTFYVLGGFSFFLGLYFGFYYIASFSRDIIGMSYTNSLNLLLVINGVGLPGRLIPNHLADRLGAINVFVPTVGIAGICMFCWMAVKSPSGLYVWCCFYGMVGGGIQSLFPAGLSSLTTDIRKAGVRMGMAFTIVSFATLAGPPIAGAIITASGGSYYGAQAFAGATLMLGTVLMAAARTVKVRRVLEADMAGVGWRVKV
ncbi:major facilitator superfamily domain-containing protein [Achaetomium macrosporum]|uniref:Major facilitator superfamily domain-containing protein n=1 Tax=Achaetomium macrosporum TaxID=79813 RepID=A0AAN7C1R7_9PEZI|nr:major facilitator superfamily domain-containing protein [Achaetomium macrosporum]